MTETAKINMLIDYHVWGAMLKRYQEIQVLADQHCWAKKLFCWRYGMICCKCSLILRQSYHFTKSSIVCSAAGGHSEHSV